jgi:hypothetical protein
MSSIPQTAKAADDVPRDEKEAAHHTRVTNANFVAQNAEAAEATRKEHGLSVRAAVKLYTKAIMFSLIFSLAVIMEGYDISLIGTFFGFTPFLDRYGDQLNPESPGSRIVSARWQTIITVSAQVSSLCRFFPPLFRLVYIDIRHLGWQYHWSLHQRLDIGEDRIEEDHAGLVDFDDRVYIRPVLCAEPS